jgi:MFS family permease
VLSGGAVVGQAVGGVLVSADVAGTGWRPIFLINVPIGVGLLLAAWSSLPRQPAGAQRRLDLPGVAALSLALILLIVPLVLGREYGWPVWTWVALALSLPAFVVLVLVERYIAARHGSPLITTALLRRSPIALGLVSWLATGASYFGLLFVLAVYLQQGLGRSPTYSGLILVPWVAAFGLAGPVLGRFGARTRHRAAAVGALLLAAGFGGLGALSAVGGAGSTPALAVLLGIGGLGWGAAFSGILSLLTDGVTEQHAAEVGGLFQTTLRIGGVLGVAVFGGLYLAMPTSWPSASTQAFTVTAAAFAATALLGAAAAHGATLASKATAAANDRPRPPTRPSLGQ